MTPRWGSKRLTYLSCAAMVLWIAAVTFLIARDPGPGESDPEALAAAFTRAMSTNDVDGVTRLVAGSPEREAIEKLLREVSCGDEAGAVGSQLVIVRRGTECGRLPIADHDGRWFIEPQYFAPANASNRGSSG